MNIFPKPVQLWQKNNREQHQKRKNTIKTFLDVKKKRRNLLPSYSENETMEFKIF